MLSMRTGPAADGTVSRPISSMSRRCSSQHAHLDRILLGPFLVERNLIVARDRQPQRVAHRRHPDAEIGGAPAIDRDMHFGIRQAEVDLHLSEARHLLRLCERARRVFGDLLEVGPENVGGDGEPALRPRRYRAHCAT